MAVSTKPNFFLRRPVLSAVISIVISLVGALAMNALPIAQYPELAPPTVNVSVTYPGASAETIASTVLAPLEVSINGVENMLYMTSSASSGSGSGSISVYFSLDTNPDMALVNVNNRVSLSQTTLPEDVRRQGVSVVKRSPAMLQAFSFFSPDGRYSGVYIHNWMTINVVDELKRIPGVGDCMVFGSMDYAMRVWLQPDKLAKYGLSVAEVRAAIQEQNSQYAPGRLGDMPSLPSTRLTWQIDTQGRLVTPEEFGDIIIRNSADSAMLRLKDVARIELGGQDYNVSARFSGMQARMGAVYLLPGANAIATGDMVLAKLEEIAQRLPDGLEYKLIVDNNEFVMESIKEVVATLLEAMILVFIVVYVFLQNWRATLIPCIAVPVSILGTFAGLYAFGYTINTLTLFAMVLAIGIVVDDAIVVLENVERIMASEHLPPREATAKAMNEVTAPVIAIVLVLCSVFIPVSFMGGLAGQMYKQFAITISVSVVLSGIVALTLTPALCTLLLRPHHGHGHTLPRPFVWFNYTFSRITRRYVNTVRFLKASHLRTLSLCALMFAAIFWLIRTVPGGLVPDEDQGYFLGIAILDDGASQTRTEGVNKVLNDFMLKNPAVEASATLAGLDLTSMSVKSNYATFFATLKPWDQRKGPGMSAGEVVQSMGAVNIMQPEAFILSFTPPPISGMSNTGGFDAYIQMRGEGSLQDLEQMANRFVAEATAKNADGSPKYPAIGVVRNLFTTGSPQLYANLDRERCKDMGISISDAYAAMGATFGSTYVNDFNLMGRTFKVLLRSEAQYRDLPENLGDVHVPNKKGEMVPLSAVMTLERRTAPQVVERYNTFPAAHIMGSPSPGYSSGQALAEMEKAAAAALTADYALGWVGSALQEKLASADTTLIFALALLMVFLILAAQYESWSLPLAVLTAVPFGVFGALLATWVRDFSNDVYFQVALITLVGLSAKNAILIVEFAVEAWRGGRSLDAAALHASKLRFRPIIMTSLAFILGCVPLAVSSGAGANSRQAIGTAVVGGMLAATCIATLFVPYFFKAIMQLSLKLQGKTDPNAHKSPLDAEQEEI
ncbi:MULTISPECIES: efflux RND transporter permease subunit [unclassified Desulfovibrio]|uniref:efflux RND transporter permease subunit n=1 Tax=unclassified Desulfovibrio TaxID=2593640 RepID=UPI000F600936|nr:MULTISPECIES: multidrug efflux RND transporter permease subunit [unclassified Desulfovibrio]RRD69984.1 multidrug efflux RND transporter permease subunit [Desulfovibrio sp. OH1209_COT-279]RRD86542.1 multidrug efflux RND transporter permease subunit [Desulfovibrio sp. OH1186_COT-070]